MNRISFVSLVGALVLLGACSSSTISPSSDPPASLPDGGTAGVDASISDAAIEASTDAAPEDAASDSPGPDAGQLIALSLNGSAACQIGGFAPSASEDGYWAVARVPDPPTYPFTVTRIEYTLAHGGATPCDASLAHDVAVYKSTGSAPLVGEPAMSVSVPSQAGITAHRTVQTALTTPLQLQSGEHAFVALKLRYASATQRLCAATCTTTPTNFVAGANFYTNASRTSSVGLETFGATFLRNFEMKALGR